MPIDLGLTRINKLIRLLQYPFPWRAIHVAGTNGKGSICAYISSALTHSNLCTGRFTSPHLLDRWDCISINERPISKNTFLSVEGYVKRLSIEHGVDATEFEILTATAFEVFSREKVQVAVIEVGIGGRGDATNVFLGYGYGEAGKEGMRIGQKEEQPNQQPVVTVITKIGMDHEGFLGKTIGEIAWQKAGIIKTGVPVVIDGSNSPEALTVIEDYSKEVKSGKVRSVLYSPPIKEEATKNDDQRVRIVTKELGEMSIKVPLHGGYQYQNTRVACEVLSLASHTYSEITPSSVTTGIEKTRWPGRLDWVDLTPLIPESNGRKVLLDGAHNPQAAKELGKYVNGLRRRGIRADGVNWVIGVTKGKDADEILRLILIEGDRVFAVPFEEVDGMPWVKPMETKQIVKAARGLLGGRNDICDTWECESEVEGLEKAVRDAEKSDRVVVVAGSLYLVGSVLRKVREKTEGMSSTDNSIRN